MYADDGTCPRQATLTLPREADEKRTARPSWLTHGLGFEACLMDQGTS